MTIEVTDEMMKDFEDCQRFFQDESYRLHLADSTYKQIYNTILDLQHEGKV